MTDSDSQRRTAIVTAFFDIGRGGWQVHARSNDWYLSRFAHLARLANPMVVYTEPDMASDVLAVREAVGQGALTTVVPVEDFRAGQDDLLERIAAVQRHPAYREFVADSTLPVTWNWDYALLGYLRHAFVNHAVATGLVDVDADLVAWVDIGYLRHAGDLGGALGWSHGFDPDVLHLFAPAPYRDRLLGFDLVRQASMPLFSGVMVGSPDAWAAAAPALDAPVRQLLGSGLVGDAAVVTYLAEQEDPDLFEVHEVDVLRHGRSAVLRLFNDLADPAAGEPEPTPGEPDVLVMIPTRGRPGEAAACLAALHAHSVRSDIVLGVDEDDPALDAYRAIPGARVDVLPPVRAVGALNLLASRHGAGYGYLSFLADDQRVRTPGWDDVLVRAIDREPWGVASGADGRGGWAQAGLVVRSAMARALGYFAQPALVDGGVADWLRALGEGLGSLRLGDAVVEDVGGAPPRGPAYPVTSVPREIARLERATGGRGPSMATAVAVAMALETNVDPAAGIVAAAGRKR